jgi:hypothetical protein
MFLKIKASHSLVDWIFHSKLLVGYSGSPLMRPPKTFSIGHFSQSTLQPICQFIVILLYYIVVKELRWSIIATYFFVTIIHIRLNLESLTHIVTTFLWDCHLQVISVVCLFLFLYLSNLFSTLSWGPLNPFYCHL